MPYKKHLNKGHPKGLSVVLQLVSVLKEVSYLGASQMESIPETAAEIYSSKESFRTLVASLELMVTWYNKILQTILEVEYPLVQGQLQAIDIQLREAEETLNWKTEGELCFRKNVHEMRQINKTSSKS